jgi:hypothetical protein
MWICIMGAPSTGKEVISSLLKKKDFEEIKVTTTIKCELHYLVIKLVEQTKAQSQMFDKNVFTHRTIWDTFEVMAKVSLQMEKISEKEYEDARIGYNAMELSVQPPNLVIFTRMEKRDIQNRTLLQGRRPDDREISMQIELYEEFISRVRVPKIELDMSKSIELISEELNFGIDSVKSMVLTQKTIWSRSMFY